MIEQRASRAVRAWLVDVWETVLTFDGDRLWRDVARVASTSPDRLHRAAERSVDEVLVGRRSLHDALAAAMLACDIAPTAGMVEEAVETWQESLAATVSVFGDARSFLERRRERGELIALVSNCGDDTRPVLELTGLDRLADALVLSCELGVAKPDVAIYEHALGLLGMKADTAAFIDDQWHYAEGATRAGLLAVHLDRAATNAPELAGHAVRVHSFEDIESALRSRE